MTTTEELIILWIVIAHLSAVSLALLSLAVTVIGWTITAHRQKELLKQQRAALAG